MKKLTKILSLVVMAMIVLSLSGCKKTSNESLEFTVATGDKIVVTLDTTDSDYHINAGDNGVLEVKNGDTVVITSMWSALSDREVIEQMVAVDGLELEDKGSYSVCETADTNQIVYVMDIKNTNTMITILGNGIAESKDVFGRLTFSKK